MNDTEATTRFFGFHGDELMLELGALNKGKNKEMFELLMDRKYRASDLGISRRVLSYWRGSGLMDIHDDNPEQVKLNYVGLFWLVIITELRNFGLPLEKIKRVKEQLFGNPDIPLFELYTLFTLTREKIDIFMLVAPDGRTILGSRNEIDVGESFGMIEENYIKINFNIVRNRILKKKIKIIRQPFLQSVLSEKEISILDLIRDGEYKEIAIRFANGAITTISKKSLSQNPDPIAEIKKLIASGDDFCEISLKKQDGRFVVMEKSVTEKP